MVGERNHPVVIGNSRVPHRLAVGTAAVTVLLIFVGGVVTNTGSAMAVPDWPTTFGYNMFLYPWSQMVGGIFYEHSHRLLGSLVGMLTIALAVSLWISETRKWMRWLGVVAVAAVILQGVLGGLRVVLVEHGLAIVHGCVAHAFLALIVGLAVCTSADWAAATSSDPLRDARLRTLALVVTPLLYLQIVFGALVTHTAAVGAHLLCACLLTVCIGLIGQRILTEHSHEAALRRPMLLLLGELSGQLVLGCLAFLRRFTLLGAELPAGVSLSLPTTHRLLGAIMLATAVVLTLRILRRVPGAAQVSDGAVVAPQRAVAIQRKRAVA
jgi:heme a synthase